jgi:hypothetical protein
MAPPTPPSALVITATEVGKLHLHWTAPSPALEVPAEYWIYSGTSLESLTGTTVEAMIGTDVTEYTSADLGTGVTRYYDVYTATDIGVTNELSTTGAGPESGTTWDAPEVPTDLVAVGGLFEISLSWTVPASVDTPITGYNVYSGTSAGAVVLLTSTDTNSYIDISLGTGVTVYYKVSAVNLAGESVQSDEAHDTTFDVPGAPTGLSIEPGDGQVYVTTWIAPVDNGGTAITDYYLYRGTSALVMVKIHEMGTATVTPYLDDGLTNGVTYYYKISAVNEIGEGAKSAEAHGLVTAAPVTLTNQYLYNAESLREFVFDLSGASSYVLPVATNFLILSIHASFASTTNVTNAHYIVVDKTAKTVKVFDASGLSPLEFNLSVVAVCRDKLFQNDI